MTEVFGRIWDGVKNAVETPAPNGWFHRDLLWFGGVQPGALLLSRGARLELPDLKTADPATRDSYYEAMGGFLSQLGSQEAIQFQWRVDADYEKALEAYREAGRDARGWCARVRAERHDRYRRRMAEGRLRRECLEVYVGRRGLNRQEKGLVSTRVLEAHMAQTATGLGERFRQLEGRLPGARVEVMGDREHCQAWRAFCQPSLRVDGAVVQSPDPESSIMENCWPGGGVASRDADGGVCFRMDGAYHSLLVIRKWPMETWFGIVWALTGALAANYCFTLSCRPLDAASEVLRTEEQMRRLRGSRMHEQKDSLDDVLQRKKAKISALQGGFARPFNVLPVLRVWAHSLEALSMQVQMLKEAVGAMAGAQCHQVDDPVQAKCLFYETLPGWLGGAYRDWDLFALAGTDASVCFLQDLLPLSSTYTGHLTSGDALYDGASGGLVGLRSFSEGTPQHGVVLGTTRSGKSSQVIDYLSQSDCFFAFRAIVEEGMSYGTMVSLLGGESVVLHPDGELCINYFDTNGTPLGRGHVAAAAGLLLVMTGRPSDPEAAQRRKALLAEYVAQQYTDAWADVRGRDPSRELVAARRAVLLERRRRAVSTAYRAPTLSELYADMMEWAGAHREQWEEELAGVGEEVALAFARRPETTGLVRDMGAAFMRPEEFPSHTSLVECLRYGRMSHHSRVETDQLASRLSAWQRGGSNGRLFDGVSNRSLAARLLHFELGLLPSSNAEMKEAAVHLLANQIRQRIIALPRALRKQFIFEEPSRYLKVGGMEELLAEFYAQLGKFGCQILPVTQQYGQLASSTLRPVIFGNSKQYWLFRQNDRQDLDAIGDAVGLPEAARAAVRRFTAPEYQTTGERYSEMAVHAIEGEGASCGVVRNIASAEMLYVSASSGECHDARTRLLASAEDPLEVVRVEAEQLEKRRKS